MREIDQCIYVIQNKEFNITKIGISTNVEKRKIELQVGCGCLLDVCYTSKYITNACYFEGLVHKYFEDKRKIGEWFYVQPKDVIPVIENLLESSTSNNIINDYNNGLSITKIAKANNVTRQAIIWKLKYYGIHKSKLREVKKLPTQPKQPIINHVLDKSEIYLDDEEPLYKDKNMKRIEPNIYYNGEWYKVILYINKEMKTAYTKDINKAYTFKQQYT